MWENGAAGYQPSQHPYDWFVGGSDMVVFSVRRLRKTCRAPEPQRTESRCGTGRRPQRTAPSPGRRSTRGAL